MVTVATDHAEFVEHVVVEFQIVEVETVVGHRPGFFCKLGVYERQDRAAFLRQVVQSDAEFSIGDDRVLVRPDISDLELVKAEQFIEAE